jgi:hypothetical protein
MAAYQTSKIVARNLANDGTVSGENYECRGGVAKTARHLPAKQTSGSANLPAASKFLGDKRFVMV